MTRGACYAYTPAKSERTHAHPPPHRLPPFNDHAENPSQLIAQSLHNTLIAETKIHSLILPVEFGPDRDLALQTIAQLHPIAVLSLGLAATAPHIHIERIALNLRIADDGSTLIPILESAPLAYFSTLPVDKITAAIRKEKIPASAHTHAGNYVCNHLMFHLLHHFAQRSPRTPSGFIHLPPTSVIPLPQQTQAITTALQIIPTSL
jgi:pyroglutamyl-peptidase